MKLTKAIVFIAALSLVPASMALAETKVKLSNVHLCCGKCVKGVEEAVAKVPGATVEVDKDAGTVAVTAPDDATAKKAVGAISNAGYYGKSDNGKIKTYGPKVEDAKVSELKITNLHLCCGKCVKAFDAAMKKVDGVTEHDAEEKKKTATIKGNFSPKAVFAALNEAGLNGRVPKAKK